MTDVTGVTGVTTVTGVTDVTGVTTVTKLLQADMTGVTDVIGVVGVSVTASIVLLLTCPRRPCTAEERRPGAEREGSSVARPGFACQDG